MTAPWWDGDFREWDGTGPAVRTWWLRTPVEDERALPEDLRVMNDPGDVLYGWVGCFINVCGMIFGCAIF